LNENNVDRRPTPRVRTNVAYPEAARAKNLTGYVTLNLLIGEDGNVRNVKVLSANPTGVFEEAAVNAVRNWVFDPAMNQNRRVEVWAKQTIRFNLN
jgi:protein TonB